VLGIARIASADGDRIALYDGQTDRVAPLHEQPADWTRAMALLAADLESLAHDDWVDGDDATFLPPVGVRSRVICVAQNYSAHAKESSGSDSPPEPVMFLKPQSAFVGHRRDTAMVAATSFFDWEAELGVVVGAELLEADEAEARAAITGYTIANDGTARDLQPIELGGRGIVDWFSAKSIDDSSVLGPAIFPARLVPDEGRLRIVLRRNGEVMQDDVAGSMTVRPEALLARISRLVALHPGDIVLTGTPAGVGKARGVSLADGDELEISVEPLGTVRTRIAARPARR
jgi:2-keto-4-pentenoate hydratase/2-oxohepta-3-ene-1,7-dioic acid hydratase in catechol pathway